MPFMESFSRMYWMSFIIVAVLYSAVVYFLLLPYRHPVTRGEALRRRDILKETDRLLEVALIVVLIVSVTYVVARYASQA